jgi:adenosylcobinamide-GDP ribazoletransferase
MRLYIIALQFLTIIPLPGSVRCERQDLGRAMACFPLVGLTIGGILVGADYFLGLLFPRSISDLLLVGLGALLTGALHLDGLADVWDGIAARGGRERFLAVMKDSRIGAVGVVALVLALLLKYQALLALHLEWKRSALFLAPALARLSQVAMAVGSRAARQDGLAATFLEGAGRPQLATALVTAVIASWLLLGGQGMVMLGVVLLFTWLARGWFHRRLGGVTGDAMGCVSELSEIICLLVVVAGA